MTNYYAQRLSSFNTERIIKCSTQGTFLWILSLSLSLSLCLSVSLYAPPRPSITIVFNTYRSVHVLLLASRIPEENLVYRLVHEASGVDWSALENKGSVLTARIEKSIRISWFFEK